MLFRKLLLLMLAPALPLGAENLSVADAVKEALARSPQVLAAQAQARAAEGDAYQVLAPYDPRFSFSATHSQLDQPQSLALLPSLSTQDAASAQFSTSLPVGTRLRADLGYGFSQTPTQGPSPFNNPFNPQYTHGLGFGVTQNLLRDLVHLPGLATVRGGLAMVDAARARARHAAEQGSLQAIRAWAAWSFAAENARIKASSLEEARIFFERTQRKYGTGLQERSELLQAESTMATREAEDLDAQELLRASGERLWLLLGRAGAPGPDDAPVGTLPELPAPPTPAEAWKLAQSRRADLRAAELDLRSAEAFEAVAKSDALWELSLNYSYRGASLRGDNADSFADALTGAHPNHTVGAMLSFPLLSYSGGGKRGSAQARLDAARNAHRAALDSARQELDAALRDLERQSRKLELARRRATLETAKMKEVQAQYSQGRVSGRELLLNQDDLLRARAGLALAEQDSILARAQLQTAGGGLLDALGHAPVPPTIPFKEKILRVLP